MRKAEASAIVTRRLSLSPGRVNHLIQRVSEAGMLPVARGADIPDLGSIELVRLVLACICDKGLGNAASTVTAFEALQTPNGVNLADVLEAIILGHVPTVGLVRQAAIFQLNPPGATIVSGGHHLRFGAEQSTEAASRTTYIPGDQLAAIALEFQGLTPEQADEAIAVGRLSHALN
jgi:hypothetical protein